MDLALLSYPEASIVLLGSIKIIETEQGCSADHRVKNDQIHCQKAK